MNRRASLVLVAVAMAIAAWLLVPRLQAPAAFDGKYAYLPMARHVLEQGWAYMARPESVSYAPLAFLYPALLGANEALVREANIVLYCVAIAFAFFSLRPFGRGAGVIAAFLVALSPTLRPYIADVLTEPPFVFLVAAWALCVSRLASGDARWGWAIAGGIAMALATLFRPATMYFVPLAMVFFAWRRRWPLAALHGVAAIGIGLWVLRNAIVFGFPTVAAGAGGALYFGVNPLVDGFDPPYYGLQFDSGLAQDSDSHLSIHSDRVLGGIAMTELLDTPLAVLARMFAHKLFAFLFVTSAETSGEPIAWLRTWRVALLVLAAAGLYSHRKSVFAMTVAAFVAYMVAVHIPVLYTHRYSVSAIDYPLSLLAALGLASFAHDARLATLALAAIVVGVGIGLVDASAAGPLAPHPERIPHEVVWLADVEGGGVVAPDTSIDITFTKSDKSPPWDLSMVQVDLSARAEKPGACAAMVVRFRKAAEEKFAPERFVRVALAQDAAMHRYTIGSTVPLGLDGAGTLRLQPQCNSAAQVKVGTVAVIAPRRELHYRDRYRERR